MGISGCLFSSPATCINLSVTLLSMGSLNIVILFSNIIATSARSVTTLKGAPAQNCCTIQIHTTLS